MRRVLLVDADPELLTARGDELAADGFEPILAGSAPGARAKLPAAEVMIIGALDTAPAALELLRQVRAGRVPGADPGLAILRSAPTKTTSSSVTTRRAPTSRCPRAHHRC